MKITQIIEGPCDVATTDEVAHMSGTEYDRYAEWKKDCEAEERTTPLSGKRFEKNVVDMRKNTKESNTISSRQTLNVQSKGGKERDNYTSHARDYDSKKGLTTHTVAQQFDGSTTDRFVMPGGSGVATDKHGVEKKIQMKGPQSWAYDKPKLNASKKVESYDDYHGDMSKEEYDKTVNNSEMEYTVWVGGTEPNDNWLTYDEALTLYDKFKAQGHEDVQLDARIKQEIPQDIPMGIRPIPKFEAKNEEDAKFPNREIDRFGPEDDYLGDEEEVWFNYEDIGGNIIVNPKSTIEDQIGELLNRYYDISPMEFDPSKIEITTPDQTNQDADFAKTQNARNTPKESVKEKQEKKEPLIKAFDPKTASALMKLKAKYPQADNVLAALLADVENNEKDSDVIDLSQDYKMEKLTKAVDVLQKEINLLKGDKKLNAVKEKAKPDFLDLDKDGDKKEPMKKAGKHKKEVCAEVDNKRGEVYWYAKFEKAYDDDGVSGLAKAIGWSEEELSRDMEEIAIMLKFKNSKDDFDINDIDDDAKDRIAEWVIGREVDHCRYGDDECRAIDAEFESIKEFDGDPQTDMSDLGRKYHNINTDGIHIGTDKFLQRDLDIKRKNTHRKGVSFVDPVFGPQYGTGGSLGHKGVDKVDLTYTGIPAKRGGHKGVSKFYPTDKKNLKPVSTNAPIKGPHTNTSNRWAESKELKEDINSLTYDDIHGTNIKDYPEGFDIHDIDYDELNVCDRCGDIQRWDNEMYWKGEEDMETNEILGDEYEAVCDRCYGELAKKNKEKEYANSKAGKRDPAYRHYHQYRTQEKESIKSENEFSKKVKEAADEDANAIKDRDDFIKMVSSNLPKSNNKAIDTIKKIVADKQNMQVKFDDGKMKVDLYTASAISQIYDAVGTSTQGKIDDMLRTKEGMLRMSNFAFSKLSEGLKKERVDEWVPLVFRAAGLAWKNRKLIGTGIKKAAQYAKKHWKPITVGAVAHDQLTRDKGNPHKDTEKKDDTYSNYNDRNSAFYSKESYSKDGESITELLNPTEYTGTDGVPDKNGKYHDPNSPKGKMIINMQKKNSKPSPKDKDGDGLDDKTGQKVGSPLDAKRIKKLKRSAIANKVIDISKTAGRKIGKSLAGVADDSGFSNPFNLKSSKYSPEDKSIEMMKEAIEQSMDEKGPKNT